jgi:hypothetical protein
MKNLAVIILGIIVGFSSTADNIGTQADALGQGLISEDGQWMGAIGSGPKAPGVPQEPDPYEDMDVLDTYTVISVPRLYDAPSSVKGLISEDSDSGWALSGLDRKHLASHRSRIHMKTWTC